MVDKLLDLSEGILTAQHNGDMKEEKRLFDLFILIYRSPKLLKKLGGKKGRYQPEEEIQPNQPVLE